MCRLPRVDVRREPAAGLEVEQAAGEVLGGDLQIERPLSVAQRVVVLAGLHVDHVGRQRAGVAPEEGVRQRAVAPEEPREMEPDEEAGHGVEDALAEVRDGQTATGQQRAVRNRVVEVTRDQHAVDIVRLVGDGGDDLRGRQTEVIEEVQQPVLALDEMVGQFLDDVAHVAQFDQADDMAVQAEHAVHARQGPVGEPFGEGQTADAGMV